MQHSSVRQQCFDRVILARRTGLSGEFIQPLFNLARGAQRSIEGQVEHCGRDRTRGRPEVGWCEGDTEAPEIGK